MSTLTPTVDGNTVPVARVGLSGWLARDGNAFLVGVAALYIALYVLFWPRIYTTMDEASYMGMAWALRQGTIYPDVAGITTVMSYAVGPHIIPQYPPGMSLLLAFVSLFGWNTALGTNLFILLALFVVTVKTLRRLQLPGAFAVLVLLHPTVVTYSRTVMSDLPTALLLMMAFLCYLNRRYALVGALLGLTVVIRTAGGIALPILLFALLLEPPSDGEARLTFRERLQGAVIMGAAAVPFIGLAWWYQHALQQGGWARYAGVGLMGPQYFAGQLTWYCVALLILYPGILVSPAFYRGAGRVALWTLTYSLVVFYGAYYFRDRTDSLIQSFILGQRYLLSAIPLFIVAYAALIWRFAEHWNRRLVTVAGVLVTVALFGATAVAHRTHDRYLARGAEVRSIAAKAIGPNDFLFANVHLGKILHPAWTGPHRFKEFVSIAGAPGDAGLFAAINRDLAEASRTGKRVVLARWSRKYRPETETERQAVEKVRAAYVLEPLKESPPPNDFDEVEFLQVIGPRQAAPLPKATSGATTSP
jgi:4-amino-4-deoxy-L-arabinose transferase-like glycosyltransferase